MEYQDPPRTYGPMKKHGKIDLRMSGYIYLYIPWIAVRDTSMLKQNCVEALKIGRH